MSRTAGSSSLTLDRPDVVVYGLALSHRRSSATRVERARRREVLIEVATGQTLRSKGQQWPTA